MKRLIPIFTAAVLFVLAGCGNRDGNRIAFQSDRDGGWEIFVMNADGTNVVTTNQRGMNPVWR